MSKNIQLGRFNTVDSPETVLLNKQKLQRSNTISNAIHSPTTFKTTGRTSPLKRFGLAKQSIFQTFGIIRDRITDIERFLAVAYEDGGSERVKYLLNKANGIEEMLTRDHMKVVFFGRTSNGKSTVVNSLLQDKVLPSGIGHTTNCFCSVVGVDNSHGYVLTPGCDEQKDIKSLQHLAHSLYKDRLSTSSLIRVFWPMEKCKLLQADVEFVDSPGVDMNPDVDEWINEHCLDADVFVLVANSESTLMSAEKKFFHCVSERLSQPNVFILNNRWDASAQEPELMEEVRQQHLENNVTFLSSQLKVVDEITAKERVYFVSAKEVLLMRMRQQNNETDIGRGLAEGHKGRLAEFERFEVKLNECLSSSAIRTKFEQHHSRGTEIIQELEELLRSEDQFIIQKSVVVEEQLRQTWTEIQELNGLSTILHDSATDILERSDASVKANVSCSIKTLLEKLQDCINLFDHPNGFDSGQIELYKRILYQHIDDNLKTQMAELCGSSLVGPHHEACDKIIKLFQLLPEDIIAKHVPILDAPKIDFKIGSAEVCSGFVEDLDFTFSLGISSLTGLAAKLNLGAAVLNVHRYAAQITGHFPSEIVFPLALVTTGFALSRIMSWRYVFVPLSIYGGIYAFEKFTWTDSRKEKKLKQQIYSHLEDRLQLQTVAIQNSYSSVLMSDLQRLYSSLSQALDSFLVEKNKLSNTLNEQNKKLDMLRGEAKILKNSVSLVRRDLEDFKEEYLDDMID